jgi:glycosyltransferase involved in cell wall biosynthesis
LFKKPSILIICDPIPTFSYRILKFIVSKKIKIWYHNHDIIELDNVRKYSLSWFSFHSEKSIFKDLDIFTLPSESRRSYFPIHLLKGKYYFLPNYPSTEFYSKFSQTAMGKDVFRIIFQGEISEGHGFEEIIEVLNERINNKEIELVLVGRISDAYRQKLTYLSRKCKVEKKLIFTEFVSYKNLPNITRTCQLGIAIYTKNDIMNNTISTASNKIYEYAALGLPVILFDHQQFRNQLELFPWCFFTNLSKESLISILYKVVLNFEELSISAKKSQEINLNYESFFNKLEL